MKLYLFIIILVVALLGGAALEYFGRDCAKCQERKKKLFGAFYNDDEKATE